MGLPAFQSLPPKVRAAIDWESLNKASISPSPDPAPFSKVLKTAGQALEQAFREGEPADVLVHGRAAIVDQVLRQAWRGFGLDQGESVALIAVGGYGRGELHPGSDIDLLVLQDEQASAEQDTALSGFLTFLWDIGLPVGHSVRTLAQCLTLAQQDVTIATNLMESRLLAGPEALLAAMHERCGPKHTWPSDEFFAAKWREQEIRHHKFGDSAYKLEPNVKEGPGGLRDIQTVGWVAKRHLQAASLHELVDHGFLTEDEYRTLMDGQSYLWRVRFALHMLSGRAEDRLLFDYQIPLAELFGYRDQDHNLAVEQFMQAYYRRVMELERLNEMLLQLYQEVILYADEPAEPAPINRRFQVRKGFLEVTHARVFKRHPYALLELFLIMEQHPELKGVRAATIRLIRQYRGLIDNTFRDNLVNRSLFMEILRQPAGITHVLRRMNRYGVLAAYWPSFARIVGRMQYDLYHVYTVDEHTLFVLSNVRRLEVNLDARELPLGTKLIKEIPKLEILYLAALFHDIAKGREGDHSELGAQEAQAFCLEHGLSKYDARMVAWLVRHHLLMSVTSQRKDISDPDVINAFAKTVGSIPRLNYLYLLTVADMRGTNPDLWNIWKDSLLIQLYHAALHAIRRGLDNPIVHEEIIEELRTTALQLLQDQQLPRAGCEWLWAEFSDEYFLRHSADEVAWHTQAILKAEHLREPLVVVRQLTARGGSEIFIYTRDHDHLFAQITTVLSNLRLNILEARIITTHHGRTLDTFLVLDESGQPVSDGYPMEEIVQALKRSLRHPQQPPAEVRRRAPLRMRHFSIDTQISFETAPNSDSTLMELVTADHPGLLSKVGKAFIDSQVLVNNARILTIGARAEDMFYITGLNRRPITRAEHLEAIRANVLRHLQALYGTDAVI